MKRIGIMLALVVVAGRLGEMDDNWEFIAHQAAALDLWNMVHPQAVEAGHPACDPNQPKRPPCDMKSCAQMAKKGSKCSSYCAKTCCRCATSCVPDYPGEGSNPDEGEPQ